MIKIKQALISVSDKTGIAILAKSLHRMGVGILSTGGTAAAIKAEGVPVIEVSDYTGSPELLDGRVKTLHPKIHAGILFRREKDSHREQMEKIGWPGIDMVVVNLYPFERVITKLETAFEEAIENIDIGGPCMLRAAAKNHNSVAVLCDPADYPWILDEMAKNGGQLSQISRRILAKKAFARTSAYDLTIKRYLDGEA
jgi:phosphoribosylaminoimidazolecarboxamide formyltransferase/IMP cyclohydrolase